MDFDTYIDNYRSRLIEAIRPVHDDLIEEFEISDPELVQRLGTEFAEIYRLGFYAGRAEVVAQLIEQVPEFDLNLITLEPADEADE